MDYDKRKRQLSLKGLFGVVTWFVVASAAFRIGREHETLWMSVTSVTMYVAGIGLVAGLLIQGREGFVATVLFTCVILALIALMFALCS